MTHFGTEDIPNGWCTPNPVDVGLPSWESQLGSMTLAHQAHLKEQERMLPSRQISI